MKIFRLRHDCGNVYIIIILGELSWYYMCYIIKINMFTLWGPLKTFKRFQWNDFTFTPYIGLERLSQTVYNSFERFKICRDIT